jgi:hypothetical protein
MVAPNLMRWQPFMLAGMLSESTAYSQGTFLHTWHGVSNLFQGSFQLQV